MNHDELRVRGHEEIKHGKTVGYYTELLSPSRAADLALQDDGYFEEARAIEDAFQDDLPGDDMFDDLPGGDAASWSSFEDDVLDAQLEADERAHGPDRALADLSFT